MRPKASESILGRQETCRSLSDRRLPPAVRPAGVPERVGETYMFETQRGCSILLIVAAIQENNPHCSARGQVLSWLAVEIDDEEANVATIPEHAIAVTWPMVSTRIG